MTAPDLIQYFAELTGIEIRCPSYNQQMQAIAFLKHFTPDELATVVRYVQNEIQRGKLDERSLAWHCIFGTLGSGAEFETFQSRLAMANKTVRLRPAPKAVPVTHDVGNGKVTRLELVDTADEPKPITDEMRKAMAEMFAETKRKIGA